MILSNITHFEEPSVTIKLREEEYEGELVLSLSDWNNHKDEFNVMFQHYYDDDDIFIIATLRTNHTPIMGGWFKYNDNRYKGPPELEEIHRNWNKNNPPGVMRMPPDYYSIAFFVNRQPTYVFSESEKEKFIEENNLKPLDNR